MPIVTTVLTATNLIIAAGGLYAAVANDLSSRYCPVDRSLFFGRLGVLTAAFLCIALLLFSFAKFRQQNAQRKELAYIAAIAVAIFALGSDVFVIVGLSGCSGGTEAGLTWDWPW